ncbi:MAG: oligosaccharide flippase family protein [Candidatus Kariarchaeaceae archaeon]
MITIRNRILIKGEFAKNAITLTIGTSIAQAIPMLFYPVLGRIYTPAEFGLLAMLTSITAILVVLATGKYESSVLIADSKKDAANIVGLVLFMSISILIISFLVLQLLSEQIAEWFNEPNLKKWLFICPISAYAIIILYCYNEWCIRNKYFISLSWNKIINSAAITICKVLFGFVKFINSGLIVGDIIGRVISAVVVIFRALRKDRTALSEISFPRMKLLAKRYVKFPKFILPAELINVIGFSLPVFIIGIYFNSIEVGYYSMTMNVLLIPIGVISVAIRDTFRQRANEEYIKTGSCVKIFKQLLKLLTFWGIIASFILFFALPSIFSIVLGEQWRIAGEYSQILLPMITINFVATSLWGVFIIIEKTHIELYLQIYYTGITLFSLLLGCIISQNIKTCLMFFAIGRSSSYLLNIILSYWYSKRERTNV